MTVIDQQFPATCISAAAQGRLDTDKNGQVSPDEVTVGFKQDLVVIGFGGAVVTKMHPVSFAPCQAPLESVTALRRQAQATLDDTAVLTGPILDDNGATVRTVDL